MYLCSESCFPQISTRLTMMLCSLLRSSSVLTHHVCYQKVLSTLRPHLLNWPCYIACLFTSMEDFHCGKIMYTVKERTRAALPSKQQYYMDLAFSRNTMSLLHLPPLLSNEQTSIAKQLPTSDLGSMLSKLSTSEIA